MEQIPNPKAANAHVRNSQESSVINPEYCGLIRDAIHSYGNVWFTVYFSINSQTFYYVIPHLETMIFRLVTV